MAGQGLGSQCEEGLQQGLSSWCFQGCVRDGDRSLGLGCGASERGSRRAQDSYVLFGVGCLPGLHSVPVAISPFSVPYLTVSAESKLFTLFFSRGAFCPSWTAYLWDISLCPTSCGEDHNQAALAHCLADSSGLPASWRSPLCTPSFYQPTSRSQEWGKHLGGDLVKNWTRPKGSGGRVSPVGLSSSGEAAVLIYLFLCATK